MARTVKAGVSALMIIGIVYTVLGAVFVTLGVSLAIVLSHTPNAFIGLIFLLIGSIFLVLGIVFLVLVIRKRRRSERLVAQGRYVWGMISECVPNYNVRINGRNPYTAIVRYLDPMGTTHIFRSNSINRYLDSSLIGRQVKVYIGDDRFRNYYVDLEPLLPNYIEH